MKHNYLTRLTALLLTLAMMLSTLPATALAAEVEPVEPEQELADMVEEALPEELDNDDLTDGQEDSHLPPEETSEVPGTEDETPVPDETEAAGEWVPVPDTSDASNGLLDIEYFITEVDEEAVRSDPMASAEQTFSDLDAALAYIWNGIEACSEIVNVRVSDSVSDTLWNVGWKRVFAHTIDHPTGGDYLRYSFSVSDYSCSAQSQDDGSWLFSYQFIYRDAALEQQATNAAEAIAQMLELRSTSVTPQEKLFRIYAYMKDKDNLQYDWDTYNGNASDDSGYTGAGALVNHKAVCQGYACMFYRLSLMAGIDCRIITSDSMDHAWVIANVDGLYYQLDPTWGSWCYFLRGKNDFPDHDNEDDDFHWDADFRDAYPLAEYAFDGLTSVTIPDSVTSIGDNAFLRCTGLTNITIPDSVTSIGDHAFFGCTGLTSVTIGNGVTSIGEWAFYGCTGLTSIAIPASVTSIGADAFSGCTGLTSITIPASVTSIGASAFYDCTGLTKINIGNGVINIGGSAFGYCTGLTSITIPDSVTSIDEGAFYDCTGLTAVTIGNGVTSIGKYAFYCCDGLTSVTIGKSVTSIDECAFGCCTGLTSITIPKSVTSIGENAFVHCDNLTFQVSAGSYGERYAKENGFPYRITGARQSLSKATITVSAQTYTGKALTPAVTVKLNGKTLKKGTDFTVSYKNNTNAGTATVTVTGKGNYTGSKSATFQINKAAQTLTASAPSSVLVGKTVKVTAKGVGKLSYKSSNTKIATVSTSGVVTGKAAGTVTITVTAAGDANRNNASKTVTINVLYANPKITKVENTGKGVKITWTKQTGVAACRVFYKIDNMK